MSKTHDNIKRVSGEREGNIRPLNSFSLPDKSEAPEKISLLRGRVEKAQPYRWMTDCARRETRHTVNWSTEWVEMKHEVRSSLDFILFEAQHTPAKWEIELAWMYFVSIYVFRVSDELSTSKVFCFLLFAKLNYGKRLQSRLLRDGSLQTRRWLWKSSRNSYSFAFASFYFIFGFVFRGETLIEWMRNEFTVFREPNSLRERFMTEQSSRRLQSMLQATRLLSSPSTL